MGRVGTAAPSVRPPRKTSGRRSGGAIAGLYAGPDRRRRVLATAPNPREFILAGMLLVVVTVAFVFLAESVALPAAVNARALNASLGAMSALLALVVGSVSVMRWRLVGEAVSLRVGVAVLALGVSLAAQTSALVVPTLESHSWLLVLSPAARVGVMCAFLVAFVAPDVDVRLTVRRALVVPVLVAIAGTLVFRGIPWLGVPLGRGLTVSGATGGPTPTRIALLAAATALAIGYTVRGLARSRWLYTWIGLMLFALALSTVVQTLVEAPTDARLTGAVLLALFGLAFALNGSARELAAAYSLQRAQLFDTVVRAETVETRQRAERAAREEQNHDAQSALLSVQTALRMLERESQTLDRFGRAGLGHALDAELTRLRMLLASDPGAGEARTFAIADAITPVTVCRAAAGVELHERIPPGVVAYGQPSIVAEIVDNLIANAIRHAPGSPVYVELDERDDAVAVRVEDEGPGIEPHDRESVFERGRKGTTGGSGLGLFVARRLARDQGGDLTVGTSEHGGAAFVLVLRREPAGRADGDGVGSGSSTLTMTVGMEDATLLHGSWRVEAGGASGSGGKGRTRRRG